MIESLDQRGCPYMADSTAQNLGSDTKAHILLICALVSEPKMTKKLYHWITTESEENHYDIVKMTFIWTIIAFIIGKIW